MSLRTRLVGAIAHPSSAASFFRRRAPCMFHSSFVSSLFQCAMDSFARSPIGREFFRRMWLASDCHFCARGYLSSACVVDVVTSDAFRLAITEFCRSQDVFISRDGVDSISRTLEQPDTFHTIVSVDGVEERCVVMNSMRSAIYAIDSSFFVRRGSSLYRVRKSGNDVGWRDSVMPLFSSCDHFHVVFRHPRFADFIRSLSFNAHGPGAAAAGRIASSMLYFMVSFRSEEEEDQVAALDLFHRMDVASMALFELPMCQWRDSRHGSAAHVHRCLFDSSPDLDSDSFALVSPVFRFLRDCYRSGPLYDTSVHDDYGRPLPA